MGQGRKIIHKGYFVTGTDTGVGKTVVTMCLAELLRAKGLDAGVMKPVQCAGTDGKMLRRHLQLKDPLSVINPFYADEPLSPHIAFPRCGKKISISQILKTYRYLQSRYDIVLVEGAGGLMVPLSSDYLILDLAKDLGLELIIVARPGLGTINHTLLTIGQAQAAGLTVKGVILCEAKKGTRGIAEATNPSAIQHFGQVPILGTIPYFKNFDKKTILRLCHKEFELKNLLNEIDGHPESPLGTKDLKADSSLTRLGGFAQNDAQKYAKLDKKYVWHPFTQMKDWVKEDPLVIERGEGSYLIDTDGKRYIDGVSSLWVNVHGHRNPVLDNAIKKQIDKISHSTFLGLSNIPAVQLAEKLTHIAPKGLQKVFYSDNGSTAVEIAIKMAYQYWQNTGQKKKVNIVHLANSYHGDTLGSVSVGGIDLFHQVYGKLTFKTIELNMPDMYREPQKSWDCIKELERLFKKRSATIAALVVEPLVQGAAGMIVWPKGILEKMAKLCKKYNVLLIADEVATGFGRTGKMFACDHEQVTPDILCLAKGLTGGYLPLAATLASKRVFDGFCFDYKDQKTFFHGHTYTANPLACAAGLANLELLQRESFWKELSAKIKALDKRLQMFYNLAHVGQVRSLGFMAGIELVKDKVTKEAFAWQDKIGVNVCQKARERGVILRPLGNVIVLMPPLSIKLKELDELLNVIYWAIASETEN